MADKIHIHMLSPLPDVTDATVQEEYRQFGEHLRRSCDNVILRYAVSDGCLYLRTQGVTQDSIAGALAQRLGYRVPGRFRQLPAERAFYVDLPYELEILFGALPPSPALAEISAPERPIGATADEEDDAAMFRLN